MFTTFFLQPQNDVACIAAAAGIAWKHVISMVTNTHTCVQNDDDPWSQCMMIILDFGMHTMCVLYN